MRTAKDILIVALLSILVALTCFQEGDILNLKRRALISEGGLAALKSGLGPQKGGLGLMHFQTASAVLRSVGPITREQRPIFGTGAFVSDNVLLTAKHIIEHRTKLSDVTVTDFNGKKYDVVEILEDADDDIAVVVIQGRQGPKFELGSWPSLGDDVICIGIPLIKSTQFIISWGHVSSTKWENNFIYDGFIRPGCSGGPVIVDGKLVGIVEAQLTGSDGLGFAVPLERLDPDLRARLK